MQMRTPLMAILLLTGLAEAREYAPRVLSPNNADAYSLKTFAQFPRWRDLEGDAKVYEVFKYLADVRTGLYPMGVPAWEGAEKMAEYAVVRDPIKMINVYPIGHCGTLGPTAAGIMEGLGIGPARTLVLPGLNHVAAEVYYHNQWHYLDLDLRAVFRRADGTLASLDEAQHDASLWRGPQSPLFFPLDNLEQTRQAYARTVVQHVHGWSTGGHTMDYVLRRGETFTRWWKPQGGRWNQHPSYAARPFPRSLLEQAPRGPKSKHSSFTIHSYGNGCFIYKPSLTQKSSDFTDGVYDSRNVRPGVAGLTLDNPGEGYATFEVRSPYVIVPRVEDLDQPSGHGEASVVKIEATSVQMDLSLDNGFTWTAVGMADRSSDLSRLVSGRYGYLVRLTLRGQPEQAVIRSLEITTWVQLHPASLPSLRKGTNDLSYVTGDHYGLYTRVLEIRPNGSDRDDFLKYLSAPPPDYDPGRVTSRARGPFVAQVAAPPGTRIAWFSAGGSFATHQGAAANQTRNSMAYAREHSRDFKTIYQAAVPIGNDHWHYNADVEVRLDQPAKRLFIQYVGDPAINNIRIYAHCLEDHPLPATPMVITHSWREKGIAKTKEVHLTQPGRYQIVAEEEPEDQFLTMAVPSDEDTPTTGAGSAGDAWIDAMRQVRAHFTGRAGTFAQWGDSISVSRAFWSSLPYSRTNSPVEMETAFSTVNRYMLKECWDWKGSAYGNEGGMTIRWADAQVDNWLAQMNPEVVLLMFGSNDLNALSVQEYQDTTRRVVRKCLANGTVVLLSTPPPRHGWEAKAVQFAGSIRKIAQELKVPFCDYQGEILKRRPQDWDGALDQFKDYHDYDVPTLIARDGVHPSYPQTYQGDYSKEALQRNGYALRNYVTLMLYADVINRVLKQN